MVCGLLKLRAVGQEIEELPPNFHTLVRGENPECSVAIESHLGGLQSLFPPGGIRLPRRAIESPHAVPGGSPYDSMSVLSETVHGCRARIWRIVCESPVLEEAEASGSIADPKTAGPGSE